MLEKRSFTVGFLTSAYVMRVPNVTAAVQMQCKRLNMTPLSEDEVKDSAEFMEYVANLMNRRRTLNA